MSAQEREICMDQYWNYIATPLFLFVLLFGVFVLFRVSKTQLIAAATIKDILSPLRNPIYTIRSTQGTAQAPLKNSASAPA
jgi:heme/copper-type cytochrome/quinol oxidase subunit 3